MYSFATCLFMVSVPQQAPPVVSPPQAPPVKAACGCKSAGGPLPESCPCGKPGKCPCPDPWRGLKSEELRKLDPWYDWADGKTPKAAPAPKAVPPAKAGPAGYPPAPAGFRWEKYPSGQWGLVQDGVAVPKEVKPAATPFGTTPITPATGAVAPSSWSSGFYPTVPTYTRVPPVTRGGTDPCPPAG